ncbi:MAG: diaminopimelate epimerase [Bacteroidota bacterium]
MQLNFHKYHGTGNDFILIDQREQQQLTRSDTTIIQQLCQRHFGIGADGLMLLQKHSEYDFEMIYFNSDGRESSMCGNGGRCIAAFAHRLGIFEQKCRFLAIDGAHEASIQDDWIELKMSDVQQIETHSDHYFLNTGSPHYVQFVENIQKVEVLKEGSRIRYSEAFRPNGTNVNFVEKKADQLIVATYERGVEDETLSCGTGVTAAAIASYLQQPKEEIDILTKGGNLKVKLKKNAQGFSDIWLCGRAQFVFEGIVNVSK